MTTTEIVDIDVQRDGSLFIFTPNTEAASEWLRDNTNAESWQWMGTSLIVDHRFAVDLAQGLINGGFNVQ